MPHVILSKELLFMIKSLLSAPLVLCSIVSTMAFAAQLPPTLAINTAANDIATYWTPERLRDATAMEVPNASSTQALSLAELKAQYQHEKPEIIAKATPPSAMIKAAQHLLYQPSQKASA